MKIKLFLTILILLLAGATSIFFYYYTGRGRSSIAFATSVAEGPVMYLRTRGQDYIKPDELTSLLSSLKFEVRVFGSDRSGADIFIFSEGEYALLTRCKALGEYRFVAYRKKGGEMVPLTPAESESILTKNASYRFWIMKRLDKAEDSSPK